MNTIADNLVVKRKDHLEDIISSLLNPKKVNSFSTSALTKYSPIKATADQ